MTFRHVTRRVATASAVLAMAGTVAALGFATPAFATGPPASSEVPGSAVPIGSYTPGTPFSSGQIISVQIPDNSTLTPGAGIFIEECAAPGGAAPMDPSACDGQTIQGDTVLAGSSGQVDYTTTPSTSGYTIYALPDVVTLGESPSGVPVCNLSNECVLYIGQNQNDFTAPHFFSQPFYVTPTPGDTGANPGDGTPESPLAIGLPLAAVGAIGGTLFLRRRRHHAAASSKS
jgi:hypothetical protein